MVNTQHLLKMSLTSFGLKKNTRNVRQNITTLKSDAKRHLQRQATIVGMTGLTLSGEPNGEPATCSLTVDRLSKTMVLVADSSLTRQRGDHYQRTSG